MTESHTPNAESGELREAILDALPNRCCEDWRTCPYDQHEGGKVLDVVVTHMERAWEAGYDRAMQDAHSAFNRFGYIERLGEETPNPWRTPRPTPPGDPS